MTLKEAARTTQAANLGLICCTFIALASGVYQPFLNKDHFFILAVLDVCCAAAASHETEAREQERAQPRVSAFPPPMRQQWACNIQKFGVGRGRGGCG